MGRPTVRKVILVFETLPYRELFANALRSSHWSVRSEVSRIAREEAFLLAKEQKFSPPMKLCEIDEVFTIPTRRLMDVEGCLGAVKPWVDGCVDAKILIDDGWEHVRKVSGSICYQKGIEKTVITFTEVV